MLTLYQDCYNPLLLKKLLGSAEWPQAIDEELLEPIDKTQRAHCIIDFTIGSHLSNGVENFLDFGCGSGETVKIAPEYGVKNAVGYDIEPAEGVTTKFKEVQEKGPYDVIIVEDVLDHLIDETINDAVAKIVSVLAPGGMAFVRCHPYWSRAGTHLPAHGTNKAYAHIFFPELRGEHTNKILHPVHHYRNVFCQQGLQIAHELLCRQEVEDFFKNHVQMWYMLEKSLKAHNFLWQLRVQYAEFALQHRDPRVSQENTI